MSKAGIIGMRCAADDILAVGVSLDENEWHTPSGAAGWSVQDVIIHVGCLLELLQSAVRGDALPDSGIEALNDVQVAERRDWDSARTLDNMRKQLEQALPVFASLQDEPLASTESQMLDLGRYPLHAIADMFTFDMVTHLRYDVLAPRGPITRPLPSLDEARLAPSVSWLVGGIPKMQPDLARHLTTPLALHLTGPGAQHVVLRAEGELITVRQCVSPDEQAAATLTSTTADFLAWSTVRLPWRSMVTISGDQTAASEFLDALNLI